jgi:hypothetical protein
LEELSSIKNVQESGISLISVAVTAEETFVKVPKTNSLYRVSESVSSHQFFHPMFYESHIIERKTLLIKFE